MTTKIIIVVITMFLGGSPLIGAPKKSSQNKPTQAKVIDKQLLKKSIKKGRKMRAARKKKKALPKEKYLLKEKKYSSGQKNINFDEALIQGEQVAPAVSTIAIPKSNKEFELIKLRTNWHQEMAESPDHM